MTPQEFVAKWRGNESAERQVYQQHFLDLCELVGHPKPAALDSGNEFFTFEAGALKRDGKNGFADVWYKGHFAIEYKGSHGNLDKAYDQLLQYRESLHNPPLLIVSNIQTIVIHPNFTNSANKPVTVTLDDLLTPEGVFRIRSMFNTPDALRTENIAERVTKEAATRFGHLAAHLGTWGDNPHDIAHYLIRLLFCLFAEDVDLLPANLFTDLVTSGVRKPNLFNNQIRGLFHAMAEGDYFGRDQIRYFDGGLFNDDSVLDMDSDALRILADISQLDWSAIEPAIFGTLFTRSLDPSQRSKLGAQYTSKDDILLIVEPVLMAPLRKEWEEVKTKARELAKQRDVAQTTAKRQSLNNELRTLVMGFVQKIRSIRVLDPACGSGNFLYISMRLLMDLEQEVSHFCGEVGLQPFFPEVGPSQMFGIEINDYAHELAQTTLWIGFLQWRHDNGYGFSEPILKPLDNIKHMDAILAYDAAGKPVEPEWPAVDVIVGNPPFLGGGRIRGELGDENTEALFALYGDRLPNFCDLVCYWFERSRGSVEQGLARRVGLLATNSIRGGANRTVLDRIKQTGDIFWAQSDRDWVLEGAAVFVSMVCFDRGVETERELDGKRVSQINADLTATSDLSVAKHLVENDRVCFMGASPKAPFDIDERLANQMLSASPNTSGRPNSDVVRPVLSGIDIVRRPRKMWTIDFGLMSYEVAAAYNAPFDYVQNKILPVRQERRADFRGMWWQYARPRPEMRTALIGLNRFIATPEVAKYRLFVWVEPETLCNQQTLVFARSDDYFFGLLQSKPHELWALRMGTSLGQTPRYTPSTTFETYPFPWPPGKESQDDPRVQAIGDAAKDLVQLRDAWLNPPNIFGAELDKRTLTNLYNERPAWLDAAHKKLDAAVFDAYGWPHELSDEEILMRLLALNLERAR